MKILSVKPTTSEHSYVGRRANGNGHAIPPGVALLVVLDGELERCPRVSTARGTWTVLEHPKPNRLVLLPANAGPVVGDELRIAGKPAFTGLAELALPRVSARAAAIPSEAPKGRKKSGLGDRLSKLKKDSK